MLYVGFADRKPQYDFSPRPNSIPEIIAIVFSVVNLNEACYGDLLLESPLVVQIPRLDDTVTLHQCLRSPETVQFPDTIAEQFNVI